MNGKRVMMLSLAIVMLAFGSQVLAQTEVESLRGVTPIKDSSPIPDTKPRKTDRNPVSRNFVQQPPLIPHPTKAYKINLEKNKCLDCHSLTNYEESEATRISQTHYKDRDGNDLADVSASRYFCSQCHVEQLDVTPLVENEFKPAKITQ